MGQVLRNKSLTEVQNMRHGMQNPSSRRVKGYAASYASGHNGNGMIKRRTDGMTNKERIEKAKEYAVEHGILTKGQTDGIIKFIKNDSPLYIKDGEYIAPDEKETDRILLEQFGILLLCLGGNYEDGDPAEFSYWLREAEIDEDKITDETTIICSWDAGYGISEDFDYIPFEDGTSGGAMAVYDHTADGKRCGDWPDEEAFALAGRLTDFIADLYGVKKTIEGLSEEEKRKAAEYR